MENNNNLEPLYKILDRERTKGIFEVATYNHNMLVNSQDLLTQEILTVFPCSKDLTHQTKEENANILYTALAVNNLSPIAEALSNLLDEVQAKCSIGSDPELIDLMKRFQEGKAALQAIS